VINMTKTIAIGETEYTLLLRLASQYSIEYGKKVKMADVVEALIYTMDNAGGTEKIDRVIMDNHYGKRKLKVKLEWPRLS